jgi:hypothetical protein
MAHDRVQDVAGFMREQLEAMVVSNPQEAEQVDLGSILPGYVHVKICTSKGIPESCQIALQSSFAGQPWVASMARFSQGVKFPLSSCALKHLKLVVLQCVGETQLTISAPSQTCPVEFRRSSGSKECPVSLSLRILHGSPICGAPNSVKVFGLASSEPRDGDASIGNDAGVIDNGGKNSKSSPSSASGGAHEYLVKQHVLPLVKELLQELDFAKPANPFAFLLETLANKRNRHLSTDLSAH